MARPDVPIPRSAKLTDTITGTNAHGAQVTVQRYGPLVRGGKPIEWIRWERRNTDGTTQRWAEQVTGRRLRTIDTELDKIEADFAALATGSTRTRAA
ncbi:hypothetical protein [Catenulispora subtropica]|uniref:Uncharacterized protein n=1 Tax=Catenulispora subtropica TaxID=450798 RepID=A0ABP5CNA1_9ACTN